MNKEIFSFGVSTAHLHFTCIEEAIEKVIMQGFRTIEFFSPETDVRISKYSMSYLRDLCLLNKVTPGYHAPYMNEYDIALNPFDKIKEKIKIVARNIIDLEPAYVTIHMGSFSQERRDGLLQFIRVLKEILIPALEGWHGSIGVENFTLCHGPKALGDRIEDFTYVFSQVEEENVGLTLDFGHANITRDLFIYIEQFGDRLVSTHVSDNNGKDDGHLCVGEGNIEWNKVLKETILKGFKGPYIMECANPVTALGKVKEILSEPVEKPV